MTVPNKVSCDVE